MSNADNNKKGGKRLGAGRPYGSGIYSEKTTVIRIPDSQRAVIKSWIDSYAKKKRLGQTNENLDSVESFEQLTPELRTLKFPLFESKVSAGHPTPADDSSDQELDPNEYLIDHNKSTVFVTIQGESMIEAGLMPGDKVIVVKDLEYSNGDIVLACIDGKYSIRSFSKNIKGVITLLPANSSGEYTAVRIEDSNQFKVWGVVTGSFRKFK